MSHLMNDNSEFLRTETLAIVDSVVNVFHGLYAKKPTEAQELSETKSLELHNDITVSLYFVGSVFGELIISMSTEAAMFLMKDSLMLEKETGASELADNLCESLNMVAGSRLKFLTKKHPKLTITAPRSISGRIHYPSVKAMKAQLLYESHKVEVCFYLDEMKLDIAESYKESVTQLENANQELLLAN